MFQLNMTLRLGNIHARISICKKMNYILDFKMRKMEHVLRLCQNLVFFLKTTALTLWFHTFYLHYQ